MSHRRIWFPKRTALRGHSVAASLLLLLAISGTASGAAVIALRVVRSPNATRGPNELAGVAVVSGHDAWAVGMHSSSPSSPTSGLIEHSTGNGWNLVPAPSPLGEPILLAAVAGSGPQDVWAVGSRFESGNGLTLIEHWNGVSWSVIPSPNVDGGGFLKAVSAVSPRDAWAAGFYDDVNGFAHVLVEHWDGTVWKITPAPHTVRENNQLTAIKAITPTDVWAVGFGQFAELGPYGALIEHFDGTSWKLVSSPSSSDTTLSSVTATSGQDVWAVGTSLSGTPAVGRGLIEHFDGSRWTVVPSPAPTGYDMSLTGVAAATSSDAWAVGVAHSAATSPPSVVADHWDGRAWQLANTTGLTGEAGALLGVAEAPTGQVWAVGSRSPSGIDRTLVMTNCPPCG